MSEIKLFGFLPRRPDVSEADFHEHWRTVHREHALRITSIRRYVQLHRTAQHLPGFAPSIYDGVPEVWFDDFDAVAGLAQDPNYTEYAAQDEPTFIDMARMASVPTTEEIRLPGPPVRPDTARVKGLLLVRKRDDIELDEFTTWWRVRFSPLIADTVPGLTRHVQCLAVPAAYVGGSPAYDGVAEMWWADTGGLDEAAKGFEELARRLEDSPADLARTVSLVGSELVVVWPEDEGGQ